MIVHSEDNPIDNRRAVVHSQPPRPLDEQIFYFELNIGILAPYK